MKPNPALSPELVFVEKAEAEILRICQEQQSHPTSHPTLRKMDSTTDMAGLGYQGWGSGLVPWKALYASPGVERQYSLESEVSGRTGDPVVVPRYVLRPPRNHTWG